MFSDPWPQELSNEAKLKMWMIQDSYNPEMDLMRRLNKTYAEWFLPHPSEPRDMRVRYAARAMVRGCMFRLLAGCLAGNSPFPTLLVFSDAPLMIQKESINMIFRDPLCRPQTPSLRARGHCITTSECSVHFASFRAQDEMLAVLDGEEEAAVVVDTKDCLLSEDFFAKLAAHPGVRTIFVFGFSYAGVGSPEFLGALEGHSILVVRTEVQRLLKASRDPIFLQ